MPRYIVTIYHDIGSMIVVAKNKRDAINQINNSLIGYFDAGCSGNLRLRAYRMRKCKTGC